MNLFEKIVLLENVTIQEAAIHLEKNDFGDQRAVLYIINQDNQLVGSLMDVDIRRALIDSNISNQDCVSRIMQKNPRCLNASKMGEQISKEWKRFGYLPIVDDFHHLIGFKNAQEANLYPNKIVIMAGGLGTRLRPLTDHTPKPMLHLGGKPILQTIIEGFRNKGFFDFVLSVNYKSHIIEDYFSDGSEFGVKIHYIHETKQMGTCGNIKAIQNHFDCPFFLINGDILADVDYEKLLNTHLNAKNSITLCCFAYHTTIPYGVIESHHQVVKAIKEKPQYTFMINCGIYVIDPIILNLIKENEPLDMPTLIQRAIQANNQVGHFEITDWIDIGNLEDFYRAQNKTKEQ